MTPRQLAHVHTLVRAVVQAEVRWDRYVKGSHVFFEATRERQDEMQNAHQRLDRYLRKFHS